MAVRLSMAFGGSAESWTQQQAMYNLAQARKKMGHLDIKRLVVA
jgi:plasmid maintenance system antidote protein VapI